MNQSLLKSSDWKGIWTALITPLTAESTLDERGLAALIENQIRGGIHGLVIAGSTGEGSLLSSATYERLLHKSIEIASGRIPCVAGLGIGGTDSCLRLLAIAKKVGMQGVLASTPAYIKAPQRGLVTHFLKIAQGGLPVCLYEIPSRAGSSLQDATIAEIVRHPDAERVVALKDASGDLSRVKNHRRDLGDRLALLSGDDPFFFDYLRGGGDGLISVASHIALPALKKILASFQMADFEKAESIQKTLAPLIEGLFWESNPVPVKSVLAKIRAIPEANFCAPLCAMKPELLEKLEGLVRQAETIQ